MHKNRGLRGPGVSQDQWEAQHSACGGLEHREMGHEPGKKGDRRQWCVENLALKKRK